MIVFVLKKRDALELKRALEGKGVSIVFPSNPLTARMARELLSLNESIHRLAEAALWRRMKLDDYQEIVSSLDEAFARVAVISQRARRAMREVFPEAGRRKGHRTEPERKEG